MSKTLKDLFEVYRPKAKDEADFVDKHVTIKHKDRNGNGDDVFNGNTKTIKRKEVRKGYDVGDDEKVYEEVKDRIIDALARAAEELGEDFDLETLDAIAEEVMLDETNRENKIKKNMFTGKLGKDRARAKGSAFYTDAKREGRKILKGTAKKLRNEEVEDLDELSKGALNSYLKGSRKDILDADANDDTKTYNKRVKGFISATKKVKKLNKEEVEDLDELSKGTMGRYINKAATKIGTQGVTAGLKIASDENSKKNFKDMGKREKGIARAVNKLTKEDIINNAINTYIPEDIELPSNEERLVENLDAQNVSEQHIHILLSMFEGLNEQNQSRMLETSKHIDGVNSLLDFAITNRGE